MAEELTKAEPEGETAAVAANPEPQAETVAAAEKPEPQVEAAAVVAKPEPQPSVATDIPLLRIEAVVKKFGVFRAVDRLSLDIRAGEFFALLGPSGCGKTTLLRMLAGFETPDEGRILLDGQDIAQVLPHQRPVNMMFQNYALFPHLSVRENIAFGLRRANLVPAETDRRIAELVALLKLEGLEKRKPDQISGGQKQRVALARALARQGHPLLLAAGDLVGLAFLETLELEQRHQFGNTAVDLGGHQICAPQPEGDVLPHRKMREQRIVLEHHVDRALMRQHLRDVLAVEQDAAFVRGLEPGQHPQQRGLAAAAGAEQREKLAGPNVERQPVHRAEAAELLHHRVDAQ